MNKEVVGAVIGTSTSAVGTSLQPNQVLSTISLVLTISGSLITITMALVSWYKKAKADGKIDKEEINEAVEIIEDGIDDIKDKTQKGEKE